MEMQHAHKPIRIALWTIAWSVYVGTALGIPVLFGPYMEQTGSKEILAGGAAALVHNAGEVADELVSLFSDDGRKIRMGNAGKEVVSRFKGTIERTLQKLKERQLI